MSKNILSVLLAEKINSSGISIREASRQLGVSATTVSRAIDGESIDVDTLLSMCKWLDVPPSTVLNGLLQDGSAREVAATLTAVISSNPQLAEVFGEAVEHLLDGTISPQVLRDLVAYSSWRVGVERQSTDTAEESEGD
ncbi:MAG TPA: helix-turn-helix domain-containing protein [Bellilinea sp.]|nr:helix-turn-helix domain-containing protein [Bellilinea sp.]